MATGSVPITAGSGTPIRIVTNAGVDSGADQQVFTLAGADGTLAPTDPDGTLQVSPEPAGLFIDDYSTALVGAVYTTGGTAPVSSSGSLTTSTATTASLLSYLRTVATFILRSGSYLMFASLVKLEATALVNNTRWWGLGLYATPTAAVPITNGAIFLLDYTTGGLYAATYSGGARTNFIALSRPGDGAYHRYEIRYRQSVIYWMIDGLVVATVAQPNLTIANNLAATIGSANFTTAPSTAPSLTVSSVGVSDLSATHRTIGDGVYPWIQATVNTGANSASTSNNSLVVGLHPSSALPVGSNKLGSVDVGGTTLSSFYLTSAATTNATLVRAAAANLQNLVMSNPTATPAYVKVYNLSVAPTVGTSVPIATFRLAATGSPGDTVAFNPGVNGQRMSTGISIAITAAAAASDTGVAVAGVQVALTYV